MTGAERDGDQPGDPGRDADQSAGGSQDRDEGGRTGRPPPRRPDLAQARREIRRDLDARVYARQRQRQDQRRDALERDEFDPTPPDDDDWTVPDRDGLRRLSTRPEPLGDLLGELVERRGWSSRLRSSVLFSQWEEVVGADVARHCEPVRLVGGVLVVAASSPSWATQLQYLAGDLRLAVNRALGEPVVERVEVQLRRSS